MSLLVEEEKRYLEARLKECCSNPTLNKHQIAEYTKCLEKINASPITASHADISNAIGDMFSIAKAEQLDKHENIKSIKMLFGDDRGAEAQQILIDAIDKSSSYNELYPNITNAQSKANELLQNMQRSMQLMVNLLIQAVQYKISCRQLKDKRKSEVLIIWNELKAVDEHITVNKIMTYKPYRNVIPFDDERLSQILSWLNQVLDTG